MALARVADSEKRSIGRRTMTTIHATAATAPAMVIQRTCDGRSPGPAGAALTGAAAAVAATGGCHDALRSTSGTMPRCRACTYRTSTTHSGTKIIATTMICCTRTPAALDAKSGIANQKASKVKCRMMPGSRPNTR